MVERIVSRWPDADHALAYLAKADTLPHRTEGEAVLLQHLPERVERVLDLGCGDGRLLDLVLTARPDATGLALDFSAAMLDAARQRFAGDDRVEVGEHDLFEPLPDLGAFDAVVSSFAIHHLTHERKRALYGEVFDRLRPGGAFLNLEHVASPSSELHLAFLAAMGVAPEDEDPDNILAPVEDQLVWLRELGFVHVDCHWKWLELALLAGVRPADGGSLPSGA
jgi:tRNA (cmo5U34)-methyltransferase